MIANTNLSLPGAKLDGAAGTVVIHTTGSSLRQDLSYPGSAYWYCTIPTVLYIQVALATLNKELEYGRSRVPCQV